MNPLFTLRPLATRRITFCRPAIRHLSISPRLCNNQQPPRMRPDEEPREMEVGELQGAKFRIEPLRRVGEDDNTKRARLICTYSPSFNPSYQR